MQIRPRFHPHLIYIFEYTLLLLMPTCFAFGQQLRDLNGIAPNHEVNMSNDSIKKYNGDTPAYHFKGRCLFNKAYFLDSLDLSEAIFDSSSSFAYAWFKDTTSFASANFRSTSNFGNATFKKGSSFQDAIFSDTSFFQMATFENVVQFTDATFSKRVNFSGVTFLKDAWFDDVTFTKNAYFDDATFSGFAKFTNLSFPDSAEMDFSSAILPDTIDFSQNRSIKRIIDLTVADFTDSSRYNKSGTYRPHQLFLYKSDISKFHLDYFHFRLLLPDSTLGLTYENRRQKITNDEKDAMYEALLNNFQSNGQRESYRKLDIEYQKFKWDHSWAPWLKWAPIAWWNFGYDKEFVFLWIAGLLLIFTIINYFCLDYLTAYVYSIKGVPGNVQSMAPKQTIWYSFVYTSNIFFRLTLEPSKIKYTKIIPTLYLLFIYVTGILCLGYLANFILQK